MLKELVHRNRSYRRFYEEIPVTLDTLRELVDLARLSPSAGNLQPLRFSLSVQPVKNNAIFATLKWAGYLRDWPGPAPGERPSAYIIISRDTGIKNLIGIDQGIAAQSIMLGAVEKGLGGCIIASCDRPELQKTLNLPERYEILVVLALGKPKETVVIEEVKEDGDVKYWRDSERVHHVPKRSLDDIILEEF